MRTTVVISAMIALLAMAMPAEAGYCAAWGYRTFCRGAAEGDAFSIITGRTCIRRHVCRQWVHDDDRPRRHYYASPRRDWDDDRRYHGAVCRDRIKAIGNERYNLDKAKEDARDQWASIARFHLGVKYADLKFARSIVFTCAKSSTGERASEKIVGAISGQSLQQCEVEAIPCRAERQFERDER